MGCPGRQDTKVIFFKVSRNILSLEIEALTLGSLFRCKVSVNLRPPTQMCTHVIRSITVSFLYQVPSAGHLKRSQMRALHLILWCLLSMGSLPPGRVLVCGEYRGALVGGAGRGAGLPCCLYSLGPLQGCPLSHLALVKLCPPLPQDLARPGCFAALDDLLGAEKHLAGLLASWDVGNCIRLVHLSAQPALWPLPHLLGAPWELPAERGGAGALLSVPRHSCGF